MGCCASTPRSSPPYSSNRPNEPTSSSTNINASTPPINFSTSSLPFTSLPTTALQFASHPSTAHPHRPDPDNAASTTTMSYRSPPGLPQSAHPNTPLKPIPPSRRSHTPHRQPWTEERLGRERIAFWDTRTSGRQEIWGGLRLVVELLQSASLVDEEGGEEGVREAQGVLDASGVTCPAGWVWKGCFDERGGFYGVPEWVVVRPAEILEAPESDEEVGMGFVPTAGKAGARSVEAQEQDDRSASEDRETGTTTKEYTEQPGGTGAKEKENENAKDTVQMRFRLSTGAQDITLSLPRSYKVHQIRSALLSHILSTTDSNSQSHPNITPDSSLRLIYLGHPLPLQHPVTEAWNPSHPISVFVVPAST